MNNYRIRWTDGHDREFEGLVGNRHIVATILE